MRLLMLMEQLLQLATLPQAAAAAVTRPAAAAHTLACTRHLQPSSLPQACLAHQWSLRSSRCSQQRVAQQQPAMRVISQQQRMRQQQLLLLRCQDKVQQLARQGDMQLALAGLLLGSCGTTLAAQAARKAATVQEQAATVPVQAWQRQVPWKQWAWIGSALAGSHQAHWHRACSTRCLVIAALKWLVLALAQAQALGQRLSLPALQVMQQQQELQRPRQLGTALAARTARAARAAARRGAAASAAAAAAAARSSAALRVAAGRWTVLLVACLRC